MEEILIKNISLRRKRIAGMLLSEKALKKKDIIALNLELYAASQAVDSAQKYLIEEQLKLTRLAIQSKNKKNVLRHISLIEKIIRQI